MWVGDDHLLHIDNSRFHESYQRYRYDEILAITHAQRESYVLLLAVLLVLSVFMAAVAMWSGGFGMRIFWGLVIGAPVAAIVRELARGPRCYCEIHTAVGRRRLNAITRVVRARQLIDRLEPLIRAAQGEGMADAVPRETASTIAPPAPPLPITRRYPIIDIAFHALMLAQAGVIALFLSNRKNLLQSLSPSLLAAAAVTMGVAGLYLATRNGARAAHLLVVGGVGLTLWDWVATVRTAWYTSQEEGILALFAHRAAMVWQGRKATGIEPEFANYSENIVWVFALLGAIGLVEASVRALYSRSREGG